MIQKLTVPPADKDGLCAKCPLLSNSDDYSYCTVRIEQDSKSYADARPGPECVPGEYAVLPVAELAALRAEVKRLKEDNERLLEAINAQWRTDCLRVADSWKEGGNAKED